MSFFNSLHQYVSDSVASLNLGSKRFSFSREDSTSAGAGRSGSTGSVTSTNSTTTTHHGFPKVSYQILFYIFKFFFVAVKKLIYLSRQVYFYPPMKRMTSKATSSFGIKNGVGLDSREFESLIKTTAKLYQSFCMKIHRNIIIQYFCIIFCTAFSQLKKLLHN